MNAPRRCNSARLVSCKMIVNLSSHSHDKVVGKLNPGVRVDIFETVQAGIPGPETVLLAWVGDEWMSSSAGGSR